MERGGSKEASVFLIPFRREGKIKKGWIEKNEGRKPAVSYKHEQTH